MFSNCHKKKRSKYIFTQKKNGISVTREKIRNIEYYKRKN